MGGKYFKNIFASNPNAIVLSKFWKWLSIFKVEIFFKAYFGKYLDFFYVTSFSTFFSSFLFIFTYQSEKNESIFITYYIYLLDFS